MQQALDFQGSQLAVALPRLRSVLPLPEREALVSVSAELPLWLVALVSESAPIPLEVRG